MTVRASQAGAHSYCPRCHWLSKPSMRVRDNGVELSFATTVLA